MCVQGWPLPIFDVWDVIIVPLLPSRTPNQPEMMIIVELNTAKARRILGTRIGAGVGVSVIVGE